MSDNAFAIGDWNISPRVESAYISGSELGKYLMETRL
jgi:predicted NAD/FAD-dependent oxidoreductase